MRQISQKRSDYHKSIRREQIQKIFQQKRGQFEIKPIKTQEINIKNKPFLSLLQIRDIKLIYQSLVSIDNDGVELIDTYCVQLFSIALQNMPTKESIHILAQLILYAYEKIQDKIQQYHIVARLQNGLEECLLQNQQNQAKLFIWCLKNLVNKRCPQFKYQDFIKRFYEPWFDQLHKAHNYMIILYHITSSYPIKLSICLPILLNSLQQANFSNLLAVSYAMILPNLVLISKIEELKPYLKQLVVCLKTIYLKKDSFTLNVRKKAFASIGQILDKIPSDELEEYDIINLFNNYLKCYFFTILKVETYNIKSIVYDFLGKIFQKCMKKRSSYNNQVLQELCTTQMLSLLVQGLDYSDVYILIKILKILKMFFNETDQRLKLKTRILAYDIKTNLENLCYHTNLQIAQLAQSLMESSQISKQQNQQYEMIDEQHN